MTSTSRPWIATGARIRAQRKKFDWTQKTLADRCFVTQAFVSQWERGVKIPARRTQYVVADVLRTTRSELFAEAVAVEEAQERRERERAA